ncbi:MAG: hypothetical protein H7177_12000 [Rhizobacter sp.]|nr:hypothetical protein [Bacteriovorax sp.]
MWYFLKSVRFSFVLASFSLMLASCGSGTSGTNIKIPGVDKLGVSVVQDNMLISMVLTKLNLTGGLRYNIPNYPNSYLELSPDLESSGTLLAISVSIGDTLNTSLQKLDPLTLPGGRALPGVAGGRIPAVSFSVSQFKNMSFYLGPKLFGIFIPVKSLAAINAIITSRYYSGSKAVGNISLVGSDASGENSGILLMLDLTPTVKSKLLSIAKKYSSN